MAHCTAQCLFPAVRLTPHTLILVNDHSSGRVAQVWDLIVVGAGVAGSALAYKQAKARIGAHCADRSINNTCHVSLRIPGQRGPGAQHSWASPGARAAGRVPPRRLCAPTGCRMVAAYCCWSEISRSRIALSVSCCSREGT